MFLYCKKNILTLCNLSNEKEILIKQVYHYNIKMIFIYFLDWFLTLVLNDMDLILTIFYNKMTKFQDSNERRKEISYYNYEEF